MKSYICSFSEECEIKSCFFKSPTSKGSLDQMFHGYNPGAPVQCGMPGKPQFVMLKEVEPDSKNFISIWK